MNQEKVSGSLAPSICSSHAKIFWQTANGLLMCLSLQSHSTSSFPYSIADSVQTGSPCSVRMAFSISRVFPVPGAPWM
eukprot:scaffold516132_cov23-Prasinocladus_malaysianus.AAC.2